MRILVVEDHPDLAGNIGAYLAAKGHEVDYAADGAAGLRLALAQPYDAIVLDRMLPRLDGATLCRRLRQEGRSPVPVLMLTALDATADKLAGFEAGADDYLVKPFALAELLARLEALHRRARGQVGQAVLQVGDLRYDPQTLAAERAGRPIALSPALRKLLEHLMRETHRVVPRVELETVLWGGDVPEGDVLRAHIHNLRNAIDKPFPAKLLHTVAGVGYRLAEPAG